jgi:hypothetical protein
MWSGRPLLIQTVILLCSVVHSKSVAVSENTTLSCCPKITSLAQICRVDAYRYLYCEHTATCSESGVCSGKITFRSDHIRLFSTKDWIQSTIRSYTRLFVAVTYGMGIFIDGIRIYSTFVAKEQTTHADQKYLL